jgi:rhomboid protease GluP
MDPAQPEQPQRARLEVIPIAPSVSPEYQSLVNFYAMLGHLTPRVWVTHVLIAINVLVYVLMVVSGAHPQSPEAQDLIRWGANYGPLTGGGQWWRLLTCMFVHIGLVHLAFNMWALWNVGPLVERLLGNVGFALMYVLSGVLASLASYWWNPERTSAGASGAVFGVFGALLGFLLRGHESIPLAALKSLRSSGIAFIVYNLAFGILIPFIDLSAHVGGAIAGFVCGLVLRQPITPEARRGRLIRNLVLAIVGGALVAACIWTMPAPPANIEKDLAEVTAAEKRGQDRYHELVDKAHNKELSERQVAALMEREVLPEYKKASEILAGLRGLGPKQEQKVARWQKYFELREQYFELMALAVRTNNAQKAKEAKDKWDAAERLLADMNKAH